MAERLIFGRDALSNGASSDIETATRMAYVMVTEWGMSEKLGPLSYKVHGRSRRAFISSETASLVEEEVSRRRWKESPENKRTPRCLSSGETQW